MLAGDALQLDCHRSVHYERRRPEQTVLYQTLQRHRETFIANVEADGERTLPRFVKKELRDFLGCGMEFPRKSGHRGYAANARLLVDAAPRTRPG